MLFAHTEESCCRRLDRSRTSIAVQSPFREEMARRQRRLGNCTLRLCRERNSNVPCCTGHDFLYILFVQCLCTFSALLCAARAKEEFARSEYCQLSLERNRIVRTSRKLSVSLSEMVRASSKQARDSSMRPAPSMACREPLPRLDLVVSECVP